MFSRKRTKKYDSGFSLIEGLTLIFIFGLVTVTFYNVIAIGTRAITSSKNRLGAIAVANEKMEMARNLKYDDVGTVDGFCPGIIPQEEYVTESGRTYRVFTYARYEDDPYDGTFNGSPNDIAYHDYKKLEITVSWNNGGADQGNVKVVSSFMSPGLEVATAGDGILSINVFSDQAGGTPVSGAMVHVVNTEVGINDTAYTDSSGNVMFLGAKASLQRYEITVSKSGYETVNTLPPYPTTAYNPIDNHASVVGGALNTTNIIENKLADMKISTVDYLGNSVPSVGITLGGGRKMGTGYAIPYDPVYKLSFDGQTDSNGEKTFNSISPGQYTFGLSSSETTYILIGSDPVSPFSLPSESSTDIKLKVADKNATGILVNVIKTSDSSPIEGAVVELKNDTLVYDETITTGADGRAFFPDSAAVFQAGTYDLSVSATGFQSDTESQTIDAGSLTIKDVSMAEE